MAVFNVMLQCGSRIEKNECTKDAAQRSHLKVLSSTLFGEDICGGGLEGQGRHSLEASVLVWDSSFLLRKMSLLLALRRRVEGLDFFLTFSAGMATPLDSMEKMKLEGGRGIRLDPGWPECGLKPGTVPPRRSHHQMLRPLQTFWIFFFVNIYLRCYKILSEGADYKFIIIEALKIKSLLLSSNSVHCFIFFSLLASCDHNDISGFTGSILYPALESMNPDGQIVSVLGMLRLKRQFYRYL